MCINYSNCSGHSKIKIIASIILVIGFILTDALLQTLVEESKRTQARQNLEQVKYCYNGSVDSLGNENALDICTAKVRTSFTSDVYVLELVELNGEEVYKFVHETSNDTTNKEELFFTKESVGQYFVDWATAQRALDIIKLGKDSVRGVNNWYNFDGEIEWLEWKYLPDEVRNKTIVVVHGTQKDEVIQEFIVYRCIGFGGVSIVVLMLLIANNIEIRRCSNGRGN